MNPRIIKVQGKQRLSPLILNMIHILELLERNYLFNENPKQAVVENYWCTLPDTEKHTVYLQVYVLLLLVSEL